MPDINHGNCMATETHDVHKDKLKFVYTGKKPQRNCEWNFPCVLKDTDECGYWPCLGGYWTFWEEGNGSFGFSSFYEQTS
jgi:hypothetical protein